MAPATIVCGLQMGLLANLGKRRLESKLFTPSAADAQDYKPVVSKKILCILCIDVNQISTHAGAFCKIRQRDVCCKWPQKAQKQNL